MNIKSEQIQTLIQNGAIFFVSHSGGKDSQAQMIHISRYVPAAQIVVVHSHLAGVEWEGTEDHIRNTIGNHKLHVVNTKKTFMEMVEARGMFPSTQFRQCTSDLKTGPIAKFINATMSELGATIGVNCTGIRALESNNRAKMNPFSINKKLTGKGTKKTVYNWMPIFDWTERDVFACIADAGQKPHWAYSQGMSRLSCCFCIMSSKSDLRVSANHNQQILEDISSLEKKIGHTMFMYQGKPIGIKEYMNTPDSKRVTKKKSERPCAA
jgi:3'-phosphoadenosine 5'-phosphosulfate sulfotransferase (PAPS reductase)/FAD synthetase